MTQIFIISNPFEPFKDMKRELVIDGQSVREFLREYFGPDFNDFDRPTVCQYNGELILRAEWETRRFKDGDVVAFVTVPQGIELLIVAIIAVVVAVAVVLLMPDPVIPGTTPKALIPFIHCGANQTGSARMNPLKLFTGKSGIGQLTLPDPIRNISAINNISIPFFALAKVNLTFPQRNLMIRQPGTSRKFNFKSFRRAVPSRWLKVPFTRQLKFQTLN